MTRTISLLLCIALGGCGEGEDPKPPPGNDADGDGVVDALDDCPLDPEVFNQFEDLDGCPDTITGDADGDGIPTNRDMCPTQPETPNGYQDNDGCPDTAPPKDTDGDGVNDSADACPSAKETPNGYLDADGCPDLSPLYSGQWSGQATLQFENEAPWFNNTVLMTGSVSGDKATLAPVCPLGDGSFTTNGHTDQFRATWQGAMSCAPIAFTNGCQYVVLTYQGAAFGISQDGAYLTAAGGGTASGCGITKAFQMTFAGVRQ